MGLIILLFSGHNFFEPRTLQNRRFKRL